MLAGGLNSYNVDKAGSRFAHRSFNYKLSNKNVKASQRRDTEAEKASMDN